MMEEKKQKREGKIVAAGVCLVILVVAAFAGYRIYQSRHFRLPFDVDSVESVVMYRVQVSNKKKVIDREEDIKQVTSLVNGMRIWGSYDYRHVSPTGSSVTILSFQTSDGGAFKCLLADYRDGYENGLGEKGPRTSAFSGGGRRFEMDWIDRDALWDGMDYEEQDVVDLGSEIDPLEVSVMPPELHQKIFARE